MRIAVITLTRDRLPYTKRMFEQLKDCGVQYDHWVLDNGSQDGTRQWLMEQSLYHLIIFKENKGLWKGIQEVIDITNHFKEYDYVIKIDNDFQFPTKNWLRDLIEVYKSHNFDVLSPFVEGVCDGKGGVPRIDSEDGIGIVPHVGGGCLLATPDLYDEDLPNGYMATGWDTWFCTGLKCGIVENIHVLHDSKKMEAECKEYHLRQQREEKIKYEKEY